MNFLCIFETHGFSVDEEPDVFDAFVQWLYARHLIKELSIEVALKLWTFGHRISCPKLQNYVMDYIQDHCLFNRERMGVAEVKYIFREGPALRGENILQIFCVAQLHYQATQEMEYASVRSVLLGVPAVVGSYLKFECDNLSDIVDYNPHYRGPREGRWCTFHIHDQDNDEDCALKPNDCNNPS